MRKSIFKSLETKLRFPVWTVYHPQKNRECFLFANENSPRNTPFFLDRLKRSSPPCFFKKCHHRHVFLSEFTYFFRLSVSIWEVASDYPFCVLMYMNSYIFYICFIQFIFLWNICFNIEFFTCLTLSLADTHRSYFGDHMGKEWPTTHAHTYEDIHTHQKKSSKDEKKTKRGRGRKEGKKRGGKRAKKRKKWGKRWGEKKEGWMGLGG